MRAAMCASTFVPIPVPTPGPRLRLSASDPLMPCPTVTRSRLPVGRRLSSGNRAGADDIDRTPVRRAVANYEAKPMGRPCASGADCHDVVRYQIRERHRARCASGLRLDPDGRACVRATLP
ncbi:hypothetical protein CERSUDRAFT_119055 [Gelatoporia subvermispora B]|uniref:Uncharacterized protein n=1 Tax=Ceriporiopsis subvermispora (strain B) TaxID=914234 RepID=M2P9F2_CERS8|nr:hypothetical protein CERSUDRAFT_119055 [Gelatoporia subvermispora B]